MIYRPKKNMEDDEAEDGDAQLDRITSANRFGNALGSSKAFQGADKAKVSPLVSFDSRCRNLLAQFNSKSLFHPPSTWSSMPFTQKPGAASAGLILPGNGVHQRS